MGSNGHAQSEEVVTLTVDDKEVAVPRGTNLIEAAKVAGVEVPYYCYHPHLSVPGNCRMCQVEVEGAPKLMIGCHTQVQDGMVVRTHATSKAVENAQASTLELILINHPLDCTVCDQAGHCKLQDYHYEYNARPSRFLENKQKKVKAQPLGPTVMLDGERCIACTRCIRFCDEITGTSELGLVNRGDRVEIAVHENRKLENPLSGTVVDLCPVGALTHRKWRFNTRIWYSTTSDGICPGCSTGCNVKAFERDGKIVQVKARENAGANKEWLCDEGRYGFHRFLPEQRVLHPLRNEEKVPWETALAEAAKVKESAALVLLAPDLLLEEYVVVRQFVEKYLSSAQVVVAYQERELSSVEAVLVSPDYAPNFQGAIFSGVVPPVGNPAELESRYREALTLLKRGEVESLLLIGDRALAQKDARDLETQQSIANVERSIGVLTDLDAPFTGSLGVVFPGRSVLEKQGLLINRAERLQFTDRAVAFPETSEPDWRVINRIAQQCGGAVTDAQSDRDLTLKFLASEERLQGLRIASVKGEGVCLKTYGSGAGTGTGTPSPERPAV